MTKEAEKIVQNMADEIEDFDFSDYKYAIIQEERKKRIRRRIEDRLRKTASLEEIEKIAKLLNIKTD